MKFVTIFDYSGFDPIADLTSFEDIISNFKTSMDNAVVLGDDPIYWYGDKDKGEFEVDIEGDCYTVTVYKVWEAE